MTWFEEFMLIMKTANETPEDKRMHLYHAAFNLAKESAKPKPCVWPRFSINPRNTGVITGCGRSMHYKLGNYCPFCGGKIEIVHEGE